MDNSPSSDIWVSELNARPEIRSAFPRSTIHIYDTTLRDKGILSSPWQVRSGMCTTFFSTLLL